MREPGQPDRRGDLMGSLLFWLSVTCLVYTYVGYPVLLFVLGRWRSTLSISSSGEVQAPPSVTVIVAAHNEAVGIRERVSNLLSQEFPPDLLEILVASDGSTDDTVKIVRSINDSRVLALDLPRQGRAMVHNVAALMARGELLIFTDAETRFALDCVLHLVAPFTDPTVGLTSGRVTFVNTEASGIAQSAGWYWNFELMLREFETATGSTVAASGPCMAIRKNLFRPLSPADDIDDAGPVDVLLAGKRVVYAPEARAFDHLPTWSGSELTSRARMVTKNLTAIVNRPAILMPHLYPRAAAILISHRVLRYLSPVFLVTCFVTNAVLAQRPVFFVTWCAQLFFYGGAVLGFVAERLHYRVPVLSNLFAFCVANLGFLLGVLNVIRRRGVTTYEPTSTLERTR